MVRSSRKAKKGVVRMSAVNKFSSCGGRYNPGFSESKEVGMIRCNAIRESSGIKRMKDGLNIECTETENAWVKI